MKVVGVEWKRGWKKYDLFPDESFQSRGAYITALGNTKARLKNHLLTRFLDDLEPHTVQCECEAKARTR